jgi:hypothetical protein
MVYVGIFLAICVLIAFLDSALQFLFPNVDLLANFSIILIINDVLFTAGSGILWIFYTLERLTVGDLLTPLNVLIRLLLSLAFVFIGGAVDFFFDLIVLPFNLLATFANGLGIPTKLVIEELSQYVEFDLATFTLRIGLGVELVGNGANAMFQISFLGADALTVGRFAFPSSGFVGVYANVYLKVLGQSIGIAVPIELEAFVKGLVNTVFEEVGSAEGIYQELLEELKKLGW